MFQTIKVSLIFKNTHLKILIELRKIDKILSLYTCKCLWKKIICFFYIAVIFCFILCADKYGVLKSITLLTENCMAVLAHTDKGVMLLFDIKSRKWRVLVDDDNFGSYAILKVNKSETFAAIGNTKGLFVIDYFFLEGLFVIDNFLKLFFFIKNHFRRLYFGSYV